MKVIKGITGMRSMAFGVDFIEEQIDKIRKKLKKRNKEALKSWNKKSNSNIHSTHMTPKQVKQMFRGSGQF